RDVPAHSGDPVAERSRLIRRERGIGEHRILAPVDQRARDGGSALRLSVRQETVVPRRRVVDEHVVGEAHGFAPDVVFPPLLRASMALTEFSNAVSSCRLPIVPITKPSNRPFKFLPSLTTTTSMSVVPLDCRVNLYVWPEAPPHTLESVVVRTTWVGSDQS